MKFFGFCKGRNEGKFSNSVDSMLIRQLEPLYSDPNEISAQTECGWRDKSKNYFLAIRDVMI